MQTHQNTAPTDAHVSAQPDWLPNVFHAGFPKTATTWLHRCLLEHPDVFVPQQDALHFVTCRHHQGLDWYRQIYSDYRGVESVVADTTPSYAAYDWGRRRLAELNPNAKILVTLRNPIDRAFSHYWHHKQKREPNVSFEQALDRYTDLYSWWIATGFYHHHLSDLLSYFPRERVYVGFYDDICNDPIQFCSDVFEFLDIDAGFVPNGVYARVNTPQTRQFDGISGRVRKVMQRFAPGRSEYDRGMLPETRHQLIAIYRQDIGQLSDLLQRDLTSWLE